MIATAELRADWSEVRDSSIRGAMLGMWNAEPWGREHHDGFLLNLPFSHRTEGLSAPGCCRAAGAASSQGNTQVL